MEGGNSAWLLVHGGAKQSNSLRGGKRREGTWLGSESSTWVRGLLLWGTRGWYTSRRAGFIQVQRLVTEIEELMVHQD